MRLLIITQSIDRNNPILGFFHRWVDEFANKFEKITVICLEKGDCGLPDNVKVMSLGKEKSQVTSHKSKVKYIFKFYKYIWQERKNYDTVFVHMNQEYVLLGSLLWKLLGKKVVMWRNHHSGNFLTDIACLLCDKIFCTSKFSYTAKFSKTVLMPVGIDLESFKVQSTKSKVKNSILFLGRIAPVKKPDVLIEALKILKVQDVDFKASFYGDSLPKDGDYFNNLKKRVADYGLSQSVHFHNGIPNMETPPVYNAHEVFVNLSSSGMFDKTIFEAMGCGCIVLASNDNLKSVLSDEQIVDDMSPEKISEKIYNLLKLDQIIIEEILKIQYEYVKTQDIRILAQEIQLHLK